MKCGPRYPWWPVRLVGMAAVIVAVGCGMAGVGWCLAHVTDPVFGALR